MKKIFLLLLSVFFISNSLFAATDDKHIFYLDNPTNKNIKITVDSKVYNLKPKTYEVLNLKMGNILQNYQMEQRYILRFLLTLREVLSIQLEQLIL